MTRLLLLSLVLAACAQSPDPAAPLSDTSIYRVEAAWTSDAEAPVALADFRGAPVALAMVYTQCGTACPVIVHDMKALGAEIDHPDLRYVLVSLDPARDTPAHLGMFRDAHDLDERWTLLAGDETDVQTLAAVLGVRYRPEPDGTIAHSNLITLLGPGGDIAARQEGLGTDPAATAATLRTALAAQP